jgi:hypothetical protein
MGTLAGGHYLGRGALAAHRKLSAGEGDLAFLTARLSYARFFAANILPEARASAAAAMAGADILYELSPEQLAG